LSPDTGQVETTRPNLRRHGWIVCFRASTEGLLLADRPGQVAAGQLQGPEQA
jgi:hypothetical protein